MAKKGKTKEYYSRQFDRTDKNLARKGKTNKKTGKRWAGKRK